MNIVIIDYGMGNLRSAQKGLEKGGHEAIISSDPAVIDQAHGIILPGVGAFKDCYDGLKELGFVEPLMEAVKSGTPMLGICVGMQMLFESSEEGEGSPGLGLLKGRVIRFPDASDTGLKVPHMGWNYIQPQRQHWLIDDMEDSRFYFVHSYYVQCRHVEDVLVTANYGFDFTAGVCHENILGTQFHPEKSHRFGLALFRNFVRRIEHAQSASHALPAAEKRRAG